MSKSDTSFETYKTMVASTCHVTKEDLETLEMETDIFSTVDHYYGTRVFLGEDLLQEMGQVSVSEGLEMLILFAMSNGCLYLELDSDGPDYEKFPRYDW